MRIVLTTAAIALAASLGAAKAAVVDVLTGDVIQVDAKQWHIANIEAPRLENTCPDEMRLGRLAQAKLAEIVAQGEMEIRPTGERDLEQRAMAFVRINGEDVGEKMLAASLAQRYGQARPLCMAAYLAQQREQRRKNDGRLGIGPGYAKPYAPYPPYGIRGGAGQRSH